MRWSLIRARIRHRTLFLNKRDRLPVIIRKINEAHPDNLDLIDKFFKDALKLMDDPSVDRSVSLTLKNLSGDLEEEWFETFREIGSEPPHFFEMITAICAKPKYRAKIIGDRCEIYLKDVDVLGERRARWVYRYETLKSIWPLLRRYVTWAFIAEAAHWLGSLFRH